MSDSTARPVLALMGPTASGKTDLALALAEEVPISIISVDSAMIYRGMDIGTAKPDAETLARFPHALVDICDPAESYSVSRFCRDAIDEILKAEAAGKAPLLVGGTMMYFQALLDGLSELPATDPAVRAQVRAEAERLGWDEMHRKLAAVDPVTAARVHPNDPQRIGRALEVYTSTGRSLTDWQQANPPVSPLRDLPGARTVHRFGLIPTSRAHAREQMAIRFDQMLDAGLIDEVRRLHQRGDLSLSLPSIRSVGYRQVWEYLDGRVGYDRMRERAVTATRQLAKRQMTWLRHQDPSVFWSVADRERLLRKLIALVQVAR